MPSMKNKSPSDKSPSDKSPSDFKTFKDCFPNMVSVLNGIIASETPGNSRKKVDLETIFKMVASRDKTIRDELNAANYFVETLKKMGLTESMVINLERDVLKIVTTTTTTTTTTTAETKQSGGQPQMHRILSAWIFILLIIVQYLLSQIIISPDNLTRVQDTLTANRNDLQASNTYMCSQTPFSRDITTRADRRAQIMCQGNERYIASYNALLELIVRGGFTRRGFTAQDMQFLIYSFVQYELPQRTQHIRHFFQNIPMMSIVICIICIMNFGTIFLFMVRNARYYNEGQVTGIVDETIRLQLAADHRQLAQVPVAQVPVAQVPVAHQARIDSAIPRVRPLDIHPDDDDNIPEHFLDPIFRELMTDPVVAIDGQTYDRDSIVRNFELRGASPMTGAPIVGVEQQVLIPNLTLRGEMTAWWEDLQRTKKAATAAAAAAANAKRNTAANRIQKWIRTRTSKIKRASNPGMSSNGGSRRKRYNRNRRHHRTQTRRQNR